MANNKDFKVKNGIQPTAYHEAVGTVTSGSEGYSLAAASYDSKSFSVGTQDTAPLGMDFKPDGTKFYMVGNAGNDVNEYNLSTAWDISTASYSQNFSVSSQEATPEDVVFKPDGTKMYVLGASTNDGVYEYNLSTAWDISTASYSQLFSMATEDTNPQGLFFKSDGLTMFMLGKTGDDINEYTLTTAWDISTASYTQNASIASEESTPTDLFFTSDGTKMFITGSSGDPDLHYYTLSTAWDITTLTHVSSHNVDEEANPSGVTFKPDGTKMYILGVTNDTIYQYSTVLTTKTLDLSTGSVFSLQIDGTNIELNLSNPFDSGQVSSATLLLTNTGEPSNSFDLSIATYDSKSVLVQNEDSTPRDVFVGDSGTKMYIAGDTGNKIYQYNLGTAYDISTAAYSSNSITVTSQTSAPYGLTFKPDGTRMYVSGDEDIYAYDLSTAWDISTASYASETFAEPNSKGVGSCHFKSDGTKLYMVNRTDNGIREYDLSTAWDVSTASYDSVSFTVTTQINSVAGLYFSNDGTRMFTNEFGTPDSVFQYNLSTAWDLSTATYSGNTINVSSQETASYGVAFSDTGTKMYVVGYGTDSVYQYTTGTDVSITYDDTIQFSLGSAPELPTSSETDVLTFSTRDGGTSYQARLIMDGVS